MLSGCLTGIAGQRPVLDRVVRHGDPTAIHEHLHPGRRHPVRDGATVLVVTATVSPSVFQRRVDVVGFGGGSKTDQTDRGKKLKLERHRPLSLMMGRRRSSERRDNATNPVLRPTEDPVPGMLSNLAYQSALIGTRYGFTPPRR